MVAIRTLGKRRIKEVYVADKSMFSISVIFVYSQIFFIHRYIKHYTIQECIYIYMSVMLMFYIYIYIYTLSVTIIVYIYTVYNVNSLYYIFIYTLSVMLMDSLYYIYIYCL